MAEHPAVAAARGRKGRVYQCEIELSPDLDPSWILSEIADMGWTPVSMATFTDSSVVTCVYLFRR